MPRNLLLAHSPRKGVPEQAYVNHIGNVQYKARGNARSAAAFYSGDKDLFVGWVDVATLYHDFGKLDEQNQRVLQQESRKPLPIAHEDAGVAELDRLGHLESVALVAAHHAGLFSMKEDVLATQGRPFRQLKRTVSGNIRVADYVDEEGRLSNYRKLHIAAGCDTASQAPEKGLQACGFTRRLALSCLVDADHSDTARHYQQEVETKELKTRWKERADSLQKYVDGLPIGNSSSEQQRNEQRRQIFEACRDAPMDPAIRSCDAPVGSGKTTAVMAHLLNVAMQRKPQLRHIFVVLPYTNIITQAVEVYRQALTLDDERPEDVVAEHHHRADFADIELRQLATLWKAPIIVTTAVQFFETLGSHNPSRLRKLHELPGSAVFVDEMHAAIPSHLWPQMWLWLETWTRDWGGHLVLASGSLPRFWNLEEYRRAIGGNTDKPMSVISDLVEDDKLNNELRMVERKRVRFCRRLNSKKTTRSDYNQRDQYEPALNCQDLIRFVVDKPGPRLLIVNTVQTAAIVARQMREQKLDVLHLSTALAPAHRDLALERIKLRLRERTRVTDWTLVATSCVEAGMDFSFRTGFRERASTASLLQIAGRINRGNEVQCAEVWDLLLVDNQFRHNPALRVSQQALNHFNAQELNDCEYRSQLATVAMKNEWTYGANEKSQSLLEAEKHMEYPGVDRLCRVIDSDTYPVVIDRGLVKSIENSMNISRTELLRYSVQIWGSKIKTLGLASIGWNIELFAWNDDYDPDFLGYMAGVLKTEEFLRDPEACVI